MLAQGQHEIARHGIERIAHLDAMAAHGAGEARLHGGVGKVRQRRHHLFQAERAGKVRQRGDQMQVELGPT